MIKFVGEWQPIETAPKDGTPFHAYECVEASLLFDELTEMLK